MENVLIYEATYRMQNVFAEGFIILTSQYFEGIFANDYMAIYSEVNKIITVTLRTLVFELAQYPIFKMNYISHQFSATGDFLCPGEEYVFFSTINLDDLNLSISENTVEGEKADSILKQLLKLRETSQI